MPQSGCSALHGVNPNLKKKSKRLKILKFTKIREFQIILQRNHCTALHFHI